jgi:2-polyprenyl-6-methoxyphenol hydroxylase-like FAD-dependent oxidoreductase
MDLNKSLDIVVIGGSLGGLFAAIPLLRLPAKHRVRIFERNGRPLLHDQGAGIVAGGPTQQWLERHDLFGRDARVSCSWE